MRRNRLSVPVVVASAAVGLVAAHALGYFLAVPAASQRARVLSQTGHGWWAPAVSLVWWLALVLSGAVVVRAVRGRGTAVHDAGVRGLFRLLALVQCGLFVVVEVGERLHAGAGLDGLGHGPLLLIGLAVQPALALAIATLVVGLDDATAHLTSPDLPVVVATLESLAVGPWRARCTPATAARRPASRGPPALHAA